MVNKPLRHISDFVLTLYSFGCVKMSDFVPNNRHMREVLIFFFHSKKTAAEAHRELQKVYGDAALSETTCRDWFRRFKDGDFDVDDRPREGKPKTFEDAALEALLDEDPCQTQEELVSVLGVTRQDLSAAPGPMAGDNEGSRITEGRSGGKLELDIQYIRLAQKPSERQGKRPRTNKKQTGWADQKQRTPTTSKGGDPGEKIQRPRTAQEPNMPTTVKDPRIRR
ncbi:uncharacterized protein [Mycetomoellerius zeteki]|uniref:uncharacterized protein n=1 Tax=Mycetomoellerius zeteki TaxID=64791 RepID=UPI00084E41EB|nr:PREDICTED: uncharacterized protein LOC108730725 [Trachymyrmex zeteki]